MMIGCALVCIRWVVAGLLAIVLVAAPPMNVLSHAATPQIVVEDQRHASLAPVAEQHGHTHDDGEPAEQQPGHTHSHTTSDHTHDTAHPGCVVAVSRPFAFRSLSSLWDEDAPSGPDFRLERPPRAILTS